MSEVKSIFGDLQNEEAKDDEDKLVKTLKDFIENSEKLTSNLIYEDDRHKNNQRWFSSKRVIQNNLTDLIAREIHSNSLFKEGPFIVVNASLLEPEGIENELFGIENDGLIKHTGLFEKANKGSLFIDEVGEMPMQTQIKILRVLTDQSFTRIGGEKEVKIETRIIASSTKNLLLAIENNTFRKDTYK